MKIAFLKYVDFGLKPTELQSEPQSKKNSIGTSLHPGTRRSPDTDGVVSLPIC